MGFYDVKNAKLCSIFEGQGLTHREPALDTDDFDRYVKSLVPLMVAGRDVLWVLGGRTESNIPKLKKIQTQNLLHFHPGVPPLLQHEADAAVRAFQEAARYREFAQSRTDVLLL